MIEYIFAVLDWCKAQIPFWGRISSVVFKEGELWWCRIGMNVGREIYGKGAQFSRPVLIFKKLSADLFLGMPLTSKLKSGSWYVPITDNDKEGRAILNQVRTLDRNRLIKRIGSLSDEHFAQVQEAFSEFYGTNELKKPYTPPDGGASWKSQRYSYFTPPHFSVKCYNNLMDQTNDDWKKKLAPDQYHVMREGGTEAAFTGKYWNDHSKGNSIPAPAGRASPNPRTPRTSNCVTTTNTV
jgi:mRNA interferase MazF